MSQTFNAQATASRAKNSEVLEKLARAGYLGYGLVHLLVGWLALQIAFGRPSGDSDQGGALRQLVDEPLGRFLVIAVGVGLAAMALWQLLEAAVGHRTDRGAERVAERVASLGRAVVYGYFAWTAYKVVSGDGSSSGNRQQTATARLMDSSGGRWLVALAGVAVVAIGIGLIVYGLIKRFEKHLATGRMSARTRKVARLLGMIGYPAKGVAYGIVGLLLVTAALTYDSDKARGLDGALRALAGQPYGGILLTVVAAGFVAYAAYCVVQARYRKV